MAKLEGTTWSNSYSPKYIQDSWLRSSLRCLLPFGLWKSLTPTPGRVRRRPAWTFVKAVEPGGLTGQLRHWKSVVHSYFPPYHKLLWGRFWQRNKREPSSRLFFRKSPESWSYTEMSYPLRQWETFALFLCFKLKMRTFRIVKGYLSASSNKKKRKSFVRVPASSFRDSFPTAASGMLCWRPLLFWDGARIHH